MYNYGVGIITCNRINFLKLCLESLPDNIGIDFPLVIVNDGNVEIPQDLYKHRCDKTYIINHKNNKGVGISKNDALKKLMELNVEHIFLLEDDIIIKNKDIFLKYIKASNKTGIRHFNYGPGSPFNRKQDSSEIFDLHNRHLARQDTEPNPRIVIDYGEDIKIALYLHTVAMFSYFHKSVIEKVGYIDESFYNAWEHVDHTYRIIKEGMHPPFWWFADLENSHHLLSEAPGAIDNSSIANKSEQWQKNVMGGREIYLRKHGHYPNQPPYFDEKEAIKSLKNIHKLYATKS